MARRSGGGEWAFHGSLNARGLTAPVADFLQTFAACVFEKAHVMAGVLELVDVGPHFRLPTFLVRSGFAASGAAGMKRDPNRFRSYGNGSRQFDEDAADFFDLLVFVEKVFVAKQIAKAKFFGFGFGFGAGMERAILGAQLFGGVARHPEDFFVGHRRFRPGVCEAGSRLLLSLL
jgi:hypothetical protein